MHFISFRSDAPSVALETRCCYKHIPKLFCLTGCLQGNCLQLVLMSIILTICLSVALFCLSVDLWTPWYGVNLSRSFVYHYLSAIDNSCSQYTIY